MTKYDVRTVKLFMRPGSANKAVKPKLVSVLYDKKFGGKGGKGGNGGIDSDSDGGEGRKSDRSVARSDLKSSWGFMPSYLDVGRAANAKERSRASMSQTSYAPVGAGTQLDKWKMHESTAIAEVEDSENHSSFSRGNTAQ